MVFPSTLTFKKLNKSEALFFIPYSIYLTFMILYVSMFAEKIVRYLKIVYVICLVFLIAKVFVDKFLSKRLFFGFILAGLLAFSAYFSSDLIRMALDIVFIISSSNINIKKIFKRTILITVFISAFIVICSQTGIISDTIYYSSDRIRHTLGFRYVLNLPTLIFNIVAIYIYSKKEELSYIVIVVLSILNLIVYQYTVSRLTFFLTFIIIFYSLAYKKILFKYKEMPKIYAIAIPSYLLSAIFSFYLTLNFNSSVNWMNDLNRFLGNRLSIGQRAISIFGYNLFGNNNINWVGQALGINGEKAIGETTFVDNLYMNILVKNGIIFLFIVIIIMTITMYVCYRKKDRFLFFILIILCLHSLIDNLVIYLHYNTFLFAIPYILFYKDSKMENKSFP